MQSKEHWEQVYATKPATGVSWFQEHARRSVQLIRQTGVARDAGIIDVGGGASMLVDDLLAEGYSKLTVLDLSEAALATAKSRLGQRAQDVAWLVGDITRVELPRYAYDAWHDRAVFHFLTSREEREACGQGFGSIQSSPAAHARRGARHRQGCLRTGRATARVGRREQPGPRRAPARRIRSLAPAYRGLEDGGRRDGLAPCARYPGPRLHQHDQHLPACRRR